MSQSKSSTIVENVLGIIVKSMLIVLLMITSFCEKILAGCNGYLKKRIEK